MFYKGGSDVEVKGDLNYINALDFIRGYRRDRGHYFLQ